MIKSGQVKKAFMEWGLILGAFALIYYSGWHTEIMGRVQQGFLFSGLFDPTVEQETRTTKETGGRPDASFSLKLRNQEGELVNMEDLRGKVIFINLWATWCPPCIAEMPSIDELSKKMKGEDVVFLMVSLDENFKKAQAFHKRKGFSFDVHELAGDLPQMYRSQSIPATFVVSANGKLVFSKKGMADYNTAEFQEFLKEQQ